MLKSLNLTSHAKARERNAGFREETAGICSLSLLRNPAPREGEPFCLRFATRNIFSPISRDFPSHFWTFWLIPLYRFRSLRFQIGDYLGKRSFLIEDLHSWYVPKCIPLRIWTIWCQCETLNSTFMQLFCRKERILSSIGRNIGFSRSILYEYCRSILCEHWCAIQRNLQLLVHSWSLRIIAASCCIGEIIMGKLSYFGTTDWHGWPRF